MKYPGDLSTFLSWLSQHFYPYGQSGHQINLSRRIGEFLLHEGLRGLLIARVDLEGTGDLFDVCIICDPLLLQ